MKKNKISKNWIIKQNRDILYRLISTELPLEHFYVDGDKIINKKQHKWILDEIDRIRKITKKWYLEKNGKYIGRNIKYISAQIQRDEKKREQA